MQVRSESWGGVRVARAAMMVAVAAVVSSIMGSCALFCF